MRRSTTTRVSGLLFAALLLSACTTHKHPPSSTPTSPPTTTADASATSPAGASQSSGESPSTTTQPGSSTAASTPPADPDLAAVDSLAVLATAEGSSLATGLKLEVLALERTSDTVVTARVRVSKLTDTAQFFGLDSVAYFGSELGSVRLIDEQHLSVGMPLSVQKESKRICLCSPIPFGRGAAMAGFITFPAPAADASSAALEFEGFPTLPPLPLTAPSAIRLAGEPDPATLDAAKREVRKLLLRTATLDDMQRTSRAGDTVTLDVSSDVLFAFAKWDLSAAAQARLREIAAEIKKDASGTISVVGHTDSVGDNAANQLLSERRAGSVRAALAGPVAPLVVTAHGRGESEPVADENGPDRDKAAALNRRVTITYTVAKTPPPPPPSSAAPSAPASDAVLATAVSKTLPLRVTLRSLRRISPKLVTGTFEFTNTGSTPLGLVGQFEERPVNSHSGPVVGGIRLIDVAGQLAYRVARDSEFQCLCARVAPMPAGSSRLLYATFTAPPESVTTVDVSVPEFATPLRGVPIS